MQVVLIVYCFALQWTKRPSHSRSRLSVVEAFGRGSVRWGQTLFLPFPPFPSNSQHRKLSCDDCLDDKMEDYEQNCSVLHCVLQLCSHQHIDNLYSPYNGRKTEYISDLGSLVWVFLYVCVFIYGVFIVGLGFLC